MPCATRLWLSKSDVVRTGSVDGFDREVVLDVVYDGDDLAHVAGAAGLSSRRRGRPPLGCDVPLRLLWVRAGFAYLSGLDQRLHLPRRATPRTSVPAGSVAIAGPYTAVYPSASPGGWHLLGHTDATLWDLDADPPALITPGTTVRFNPIWAGSVPNTARIPPRRRSGTHPAQIGGHPVLRVVSAGVATSLQDRGRPGYAHLGVPGFGRGRSSQRRPRQPARRQPARRGRGRDGRRARPRGDRPSRRRRLDDRRSRSRPPGQTAHGQPAGGRAVGVPRRARRLRRRADPRLAELGQPVEARPATARTRRRPECRPRPGHTRRHRPGATPSFRADDRDPRCERDPEPTGSRPRPSTC